MQIQHIISWIYPKVAQNSWIELEQADGNDKLSERPLITALIKCHCCLKNPFIFSTSPVDEQPLKSQTPKQNPAGFLQSGTTQTFRSTEQFFTLQHERKKESHTSFKIINSCQIRICFKDLDKTRKMYYSLKIIFTTFSHKLNICTHPRMGQRPSTIFET